MSHDHGNTNTDTGDMAMDMDMRMYMTINWENEVAFVFKEWKSTNTGEFIFGLFLTLVFAITITAIPLLKQYAESEKCIWLKTLWQLCQATQASIVMMLMMTVNGINLTKIIGWVCLCLALGVGIGNFIFYPYLNTVKKSYNKLVDEQSS